MSVQNSRYNAFKHAIDVMGLPNTKLDVQDLKTRLVLKGFRVLGYGTFAVTVVNPYRPEYVIRVSADDGDDFCKFARFIRSTRIRSPCLPRMCFEYGWIPLYNEMPMYYECTPEEQEIVSSVFLGERRANTPALKDIARLRGKLKRAGIQTPDAAGNFMKTALGTYKLMDAFGGSIPKERHGD